MKKQVTTPPFAPPPQTAQSTNAPVHVYLDLFNDILKLAVEHGASDVIIKSNKPACLRISGRLRVVEMDPLTIDQVHGFVDESLPDRFTDQWKTEWQIDYAYTAPGIGRFRVNSFHQRGTPSIVFRHVKSRPPTFEELELNAEPLIKIVQPKDGIILVCGATGSGKSSTMAAMLNWVNHNQEKHVVTMEDPIEYIFEDEKAVFNQREVGLDTPSFEAAIRSVLRQNPDIILIGEMRDKTTFETAISAAETGHLVLSTMHASDVRQSLSRIFEFFPPEQIAQSRRQVAGTLRGIVCQKLIPRLEGGGRVAAQEILVADSVIKNLLIEGQFDKIIQLLEGGADNGSLSFNKDLYNLIKAGKISKGDGLKFSPNPQALDMNLKGIFFKS